MITAVVVGAGPFGLSIAAHLGQFAVDHRIFGRPVDTWANHMPIGMTLKSDGFASNLSLPGNEETLRDFCLVNDLVYDDPRVPISLATFIRYAKDTQAKHISWLEQLNVTRISKITGGFSVALEDGTQLEAKTVVMAVGITHFANVPRVLRGLPASVATHSSAHHDLSGFNGKRVAVVGAGASAVGLAALLQESGADVALICRSHAVKFSSEPNGRTRSIWQRLRHPSSGLGPGLRSWLASDYPQFFRYLPVSLRLKIVSRHLGPSSPWYLSARVVGKTQILTGQKIQSASVAGSGVELCLAGLDGRRTIYKADHVIAATGYVADVARLTLLDDGLRNGIARCGTMPELNSSFESSVKGLYFTGLAASGSFGPLMRFMFGSSFAAKRIARHLSKNADTGGVKHVK